VTLSGEKNLLQLYTETVYLSADSHAFN